MRQEFQDGLQHTVYPLATAVSSVPTSSLVNQPSDAMEECNDSPKDALDDDDYEDDDIDEDDVSWDEQPVTTTNVQSSPPRRAIEAKQIAQQQTLASSATEKASASAPQALFLNFTSDLEPHENMKASSKPKKTPAFKVNGVNLLNRKNVDSKTAIERIQRRRENHNHVERRRRDNINNTILELSRIVPHAVQQGQKLNKGKVLKMALDHILELQRENQLLRQRQDQPDEDRTAGHLALSDGFAKHGASIPQSGGCGTTAATTTTTMITERIPASTPAALTHSELMNSRCALPSHVPPPSAPTSPVHSSSTATISTTMHMPPQQQQQHQHSISLPTSPLNGPVPNMTLPPLHSTAPMPFPTGFQPHPILHHPAHLHTPATAPRPPSAQQQQQHRHHHHNHHHHNHNQQLPPIGIRHQTEPNYASSSSSPNVLPPLQYEKLYNGTCKF